MSNVFQEFFSCCLCSGTYSICGRKTGCSMKKEALGYSSNQLSFPATLIKPVTVYLSDQPSSNIFHNNLHHLFLCTAQLKEVDTDSLTPCFLNNNKEIDRDGSKCIMLLLRCCGCMDGDAAANVAAAALVASLLLLLLLCYCCRSSSKMGF